MGESWGGRATISAQQGRQQRSTSPRVSHTAAVDSAAFDLNLPTGLLCFSNSAVAESKTFVSHSTAAISPLCVADNMSWDAYAINALPHEARASGEQDANGPVDIEHVRKTRMDDNGAETTYAPYVRELIVTVRTSRLI